MNASTAAQAAERSEPPAQQMPFASKAPLQRRAARLLQLGRDAQRLRPSGPALQSHRPVRHSRFDFSGVFRSAMVEGGEGWKGLAVAPSYRQKGARRRRRTAGCGRVGPTHRRARLRERNGCDVAPRAPRGREAVLRGRAACCRAVLLACCAAVAPARRRRTRRHRHARSLQVVVHARATHSAVGALRGGAACGSLGRLSPRRCWRRRRLAAQSCERHGPAGAGRAVPVARHCGPAVARARARSTLQRAAVRPRLQRMRPLPGAPAAARRGARAASQPSAAGAPVALGCRAGDVLTTGRFHARRRAS